MIESIVPENYYSEETIGHLKPQHELSERYQRRTLDVV